MTSPVQRDDPVRRVQRRATRARSAAGHVTVGITRNPRTHQEQPNYSLEPLSGGVLRLALWSSTANAARNTVAPSSTDPTERHRRYR
jgi:hypothetical protein